MNHIDIDNTVCKGCKVCVAACPKQCIHIGSDINLLGYQFAVFSSEKCTACGLCFYSCPEPGTIRVYKGEES